MRIRPCGAVSILVLFIASQVHAVEPSDSRCWVLLPVGATGFGNVTVYDTADVNDDTGFATHSPLAACPVGHKACGNDYDHDHIIASPVIWKYLGGGNWEAIALADIAEAWKRFFNSRYGAGTFVIGALPDMKYNCHSYSLGLQTPWVNDLGAFFPCAYTETLLHSEADIYALQKGSNGIYQHSMKVISKTYLGSGFWDVRTKEKFRESPIVEYIHRHISDITGPGSGGGGGSTPPWMIGEKWSKN